MALVFIFLTRHRENQGESMDGKASQKVFIVHGHDEAAKHITTR